MKKKMVFVLTAMSGFLLNKPAQAVDTVINSNPFERSQSDLTSEMLKNHVLKLDASKRTVVIDEYKLLKVMRAQLEQKAQDQNLNPSDRTIYQQLMERLQPGSFMKTEGHEEYSAASFSKG